MRGSSSSATNHKSRRNHGFAELNNDIDIEVPTKKVPTTPNVKKQHQEEVVSPATTFDSSLGSPTRTFDDSEAPSSALRGTSPGSTHHTISFDHNVKTTRGNRSVAGGAGLLFGMSKPMLFGITMLLLSTSGAAAYFFRSWLSLPGLNNQIKKLEDQVKELNTEIDRLSGQVDRLEDENNRYEILNGQLNETVIELEEVSDELNATSIELRIVSEQLNWTNQELNENIQDLTHENQEYQRLNQELNATTIALNSEIELFKTALSNMIMENEALNNLTLSLQDMTQALGNLTNVQNETLIQLEETLNEFYLENDRLENLNMDLKTIVSFLNETSAGLGDNLDQITQFLADQIVANQRLVVEQLENTYRQRISTWDCDYRDIFRDEVFGQNYDTASISALDFDTKVLPYLENRVLCELCLNTFDFSNYIQNTYSFDGGGDANDNDTTTMLTTNRLIRSVLLYTGTALDYYFPENDEIGITSAEWANASFDCQNLDNRFRME